MGGGVRPGGCERCGKTEQVSYSGWMYLCHTCREELQREQEQEARRARMLAKVEEEERRGRGATA